MKNKISYIKYIALIINVLVYYYLVFLISINMILII